MNMLWEIIIQRKEILHSQLSQTVNIIIYVTSSIPWLMRGGLYDGTSASGVFATSRSAGSGNTYYTTRMVITNE